MTVGVGVGAGGIVPGTTVPEIAVALTVPAGRIVAVTAVALPSVALGSGDPSVAAPPQAATRTTPRLSARRRTT